jgi:hypothetical protein
MTFGNNVTTIGLLAFYSCSSLESITIPGSIASIGDVAFFNCTNLQRVYFTGNPPTPGISVFQNSTPSLYYLPGSTGWGGTYAGRPAILWNPTFSSVDFSDDGISCTVTGSLTIPIEIEVCTNLLSGQWMLLANTNINTGTVIIDDPAATNHVNSFYRIIAP